MHGWLCRLDFSSTPGLNTPAMADWADSTKAEWNPERGVSLVSVNGTMTHSPLDINLCAGAGGMALGLAQAGFGPTEFYDKDADACTTIRHNFLHSR